MGTMLTVNDINVFYGAIHAIKGVSLEVNEGEIVTLIGANGAGKSTILRTISGLLKPKTGSIQFEGQEIAGMPAHEIVKTGISQVPEGRRILPKCPCWKIWSWGLLPERIRMALRRIWNWYLSVFLA